MQARLPDEADRKAAGESCAKEASDFTAFRRELTGIIGTFGLAIGLLEIHASMLQLKNANSAAKALIVLVEASTISSADANWLIQGIKSPNARKTEVADLQNYQMLKQSLVDEVKHVNKEMA